MSEVLTNARAILCAECHGLGMRTWPADTDTCRHCNGSGVQRGTCPGAAIRALGAGLKKALDEVERLRADSPPPADAELLALANRTLAADLAKVRADRDRLARILAVEQGDDSAGNPPSGWSHGLDLTEDAGAIIRHVWTGPPGEVYGSPHEGWRFTKVRGLYRENQPFHETALEAMEAADRAAGGAA